MKKKVLALSFPCPFYTCIMSTGKVDDGLNAEVW
jgi:hypothetical protein